MRSTLKRVSVLLLSLLFVAAASGAKPKMISEAEAKKAGLAFINRMFDANEVEATVKNATHAGYSYVDGENIETGKDQPVHYYTVASGELSNGLHSYFAWVNAETGVAYYAMRNNALLPKLTAEQQKAVAEAKVNGLDEHYDFSRVSIDCQDFAREWIAEKFDLKARILGFVDCGMIADDTSAAASFYVVIRDGTIYYVNVAWPQLAVLEVSILNQIEPYEGEA